MRLPVNALFIVFILLSGCDLRTNETSASGLPSPTPFQPGTAQSSSVYSAAAPTPVDLPTVTPLSSPPGGVPEELVEAAGVPAFTLPTNLNPLTGLPPSDPALMDRNPLAIKVANYPRYVRPQSGLTLADTVFEYYIEAGLTRFIAVFYGNDSEWVGPVRSGRYFDEHVQRMYHAYLVFKFADPRELTYFQASDFKDFLVVPTNGSCPPFRLLPTREIEVYNNSYFNTFLWADCASRSGLQNRRPTIRSSFFSELPPHSDLPGVLLRTYYSVDAYSYWLYQPETGQYVRYQESTDTRNGKPESYEMLMDAVTATAVHGSNIVYILAPHTFANTFDQEDEVYKIDVTGSGEAYVFRDGVGIVARWHRINQDQPLVLAGLNGAPIYLKPGITFYQVLGARSYVNQGDGEWHFRHEAP